MKNGERDYKKLLAECKDLAKVTPPLPLEERLPTIKDFLGRKVVVRRISSRTNKYGIVNKLVVDITSENGDSVIEVTQSKVVRKLYLAVDKTPFACTFIRPTKIFDVE